MYSMFCKSRAQSNNGMHPTANHVGCHRELGAIGVECAAGDAGRYVAFSKLPS